MHALRAFLKSRLPAYMIPSAWVMMEALPRTPAGKVDRRKLPAPERSRDEGDAYAAPTTDLEEVIARLWAQVLGLERVGIHDSFFELGGHSLRATQVIARLHSLLGVDLTLRQFFDNPTVAGLAMAAEACLSDGKEAG